MYKLMRSVRASGVLLCRGSRISHFSYN